jgi:hypothetical protein
MDLCSTAALLEAGIRPTMIPGFVASCRELKNHQTKQTMQFSQETQDRITKILPTLDEVLLTSSQTGQIEFYKGKIKANKEEG